MCPELGDGPLDVVGRPPQIDVRPDAAPSTRPRTPSYGSPTLPALTSRGPPGSRRSNCTWVCPQTTTAASVPASAAATSSSGVMPRQDRLVVVRRRMAEDDRSEPLDLTLEPPAATMRQARARARRAARCTTGRCRCSGSGRRVRSCPRRTVAPTLRRSVQALRLHRPPEHVTADDDLVHAALPLELREHRLERRQVAMDVVQRCDPHGLQLFGRGIGGLEGSLAGAAEPGPGTDDVEGRAAGAGEGARRGPELAGPDARDRGREARLEALGVICR